LAHRIAELVIIPLGVEHLNGDCVGNKCILVNPFDHLKFARFNRTQFLSYSISLLLQNTYSWPSLWAGWQVDFVTNSKSPPACRASPYFGAKTKLANEEKCFQLPLFTIMTSW